MTSLFKNTGKNLQIILASEENYDIYIPVKMPLKFKRSSIFFSSLIITLIIAVAALKLHFHGELVKGKVDLT